MPGGGEQMLHTQLQLACRAAAGVRMGEGGTSKTLRKKVNHRIGTAEAARYGVSSTYLHARFKAPYTEVQQLVHSPSFIP